jgi:hypothetical protein
MSVAELIALLQGIDPKAPVTIWRDGQLDDLNDVAIINPIQAARERRHKSTVTLS